MNPSGVSTQLLAKTWLVLLVMISGMGQAQAAPSQLFVLLEDETQLADVDGLIDQVSVPVYVLDQARLEVMKNKVREPLEFVTALDRAAVMQKRDQIMAIGSASIERYRDELHEAYRNRVVASEIITRYAVTQLPAMIEIDAQGRYRKITRPESFESGLLGLQRAGFQRAPPLMTEAGTTSAVARTTRPLCTTLVTVDCIRVVVRITDNGVVRDVLLGDVLSEDDLLAVGIEPFQLPALMSNASGLAFTSGAEIRDFLATAAPLQNRTAGVPAENANEGEAACAPEQTSECPVDAVTFVINGEEVEVPIDQIMPEESIGDVQIDPAEIQAIIDANPDLVPTTPAEQIAFLNRQARDQLLPDNVSGPFSSAPDSSGASVPSVGSGTQYSVLDAILDGSSTESYDCLDLRVSGVCLYFVVRIYCAIGCIVRSGPEASLELTHYNPELLVASYKRLGASPLQEARTLFGSLQNTISGAAIGVMTGVDVPAEYDDPETWAAWTSESDSEGAAPSTLKYHEMDAIGHPGTLYAHISASGLNPVPSYLDSLLEGPDNLVDGITSSVSEIPPSLQQQSDVVNSITGSLPPSPPPTIGGEGSFVGSMQRPSAALLLEMAQSKFPDSIADAAGRLLGLSADYNAVLQAWDIANAASLTALTDSIATVLDTGAISEDLQEQIDKADEIFALLEATGALYADVGAGSSGTDLFSMCPGASEFLKPYLLSGLDLTQWKFNIPEIVFPQTYAPPLPAFSDLYVGNLSFAGDDGLQVPNAWGSIYPRLGFVNQPDEMKAAAVAASRAAHVITRAGQKHVYSPLVRATRRYLKIKYPPPFSPVVEASGKWQPLVPELDDQCHVFGEDDRVFSPWTKDRQTQDRAYVFALWRQYSCCPEPKRQGATVLISQSLGILPLDVDLLN